MQLSLHSEYIITNFGDGVYEINCTDAAPDLKRNSSYVELTVNGNFTYIGDGFRNLKNLSKIKIIAPILVINFIVFDGCTKLNEVYVTALYMGYQGSPSCSILTLPNVSSIDRATEDFFASVTNLITPNVTKIKTFSRCYKLETIILGPLESVPDKAFDGCYSLKEISGISSASFIGEEAFYNCYSLTGNLTFNSVTSIGNSAFYNCSSITKIIGVSKCNSIGDSTFYKCISLETVLDISSISSIGSNAFRDCISMSPIRFTNLTKIGFGVFYNSTSVDELCLDSLETIDMDAFEYSAIKKFSSNSISFIPRDCFAYSQIVNAYLPNVTEIQKSAFYNCTKLTEIHIPNLYKFVDWERNNGFVFYNCQLLRELIVPKLVNMHSYTLYNCISLEKVNFDSLKTHDSNWNNERVYLGNLTKVTVLRLPKVNYFNDLLWGGFNIEYLYLDSATQISSLIHLKKLKYLEALNCNYISSCYDMPDFSLIGTFKKK